MGGMQTFATAVEMLQTSYKKMNPFCIPFAISNMGECGAGWVLLSVFVSSSWCCTVQCSAESSAVHCSVVA